MRSEEGKKNPRLRLAGSAPVLFSPPTLSFEKPNLVFVSELEAGLRQRVKPLSKYNRCRSCCRYWKGPLVAAPSLESLRLSFTPPSIKDDKSHRDSPFSS
ncbi:hypothetical protein VNO77_46385 [Canavalia gladiata]|uniref:Uncharacterized protein n=1 Tax=Canavalia gladiata TaxID=3824 RepID=A0AAN9PFE6_CANGL